ncbi:glycosyltransferase [Flagellimonas okinawensis]|uniref:Glycosyltransferase n=1 Tax=Flagellimonas okinawensis TaxID=3031324 RepID=A0ABT5XS62_9FLAO|nr:glycosyltransferase [[Muricauda] okinawensis]MDF0708431.1 glycosyltransferase [[Muricauda] okinawensis]
MDLSIIIPAYNVEKHIESCLKSLLQQDLDKSSYEILVVNDGSTDNTGSIIKKLKSNYSNINLITQENKGIGGARNAALDIAKGKYIYFVDGDDYVATNTFGKVLDKALKYNLDIIGFNSKHVFDHEDLLSTNIDQDKDVEILSGTEFMGKYNFEPEVWWYFIRRDFFDECNLRFYDRKFVQDSYFTPILFSKADTMAYVDYDVYRYYMSENSITRNRSKKHLETHFRDLAFAVQKQQELIKSIEKLGRDEDEDCLKMLKAKKERYVLIAIVRYFKSDFSFAALKQDLNFYKKIDSYPFRYLLKIDKFRNSVNKILVFIFNSSVLLNLSFHTYRLYRKLR